MAGELAGLGKTGTLVASAYVQIGWPGGLVGELPGQAGSGFYLCDRTTASGPLSEPVAQAGGPEGWLALGRSHGRRAGWRSDGRANNRFRLCSDRGGPPMALGRSDGRWGGLVRGRTSQKLLMFMFGSGRQAERSADQ